MLDLNSYSIRGVKSNVCYSKYETSIYLKIQPTIFWSQSVVWSVLLDGLRSLIPATTERMEKSNHKQLFSVDNISIRVVLAAGKGDGDHRFMSFFWLREVNWFDIFQ